jgi:predicted nuclease of restriction endonuclease-like (RecB) superfamily
MKGTRRVIAKKEAKLFDQAIKLIAAARNQAYRQTNSLMVFTYFHLGRLIIEHEQGGRLKADYGEETIVDLSKKLTKRFGDGFSERNLEQMRLFFSLYRKKINFVPIPQTVSAESGRARKTQTLSAKSTSPFDSGQISLKSIAELFPLSWSQYVLLCRIKDSNERKFYEIETIQNNWSVRELQRQYESGLYVRLALSKNKKQVKRLAKNGQVVEKPEDVIKSRYVLEFLGLESKPVYTESDLESAIISRIEHFLMEMGKGFLFGGRQVRFAFDGEEFFVDLVLYNRLLQCFVLVDLKIGKLKHQDIGQMQMYVNYYDRYVKKEYEKPTIGIVICKDKSDAVVEITLPKGNNTIFAKEYRLYLPTKGELKKVME